MAEVVRQSHNYYSPGDPNNPRYDPTFRKRIGDVLRKNEGVSVHLERIVGGDPTTIHETIEVLRRIGWQIDGSKGVAGYTLIDIDLPPGWLRLVESIRKAAKKSLLKKSRRCTPRRVKPVDGQIGADL